MVNKKLSGIRKEITSSKKGINFILSCGLDGISFHLCKRPCVGGVEYHAYGCMPCFS